MSIATRTADPIGATRRRAATEAVAVDASAPRPVPAHHGAPPLVVFDLPRVAQRFRELRAVLPWMDVRYDVCALAHPVLLSALAAHRAGFVASHDAALPVLHRTGVDPARVLHAVVTASAARRRTAWEAGVRRFVIDDARDLDDFSTAPDGTAVLLRLDPASAVEAARRAEALGVAVAGLSLRASDGAHDDRLLDAVQAAMGATGRIAGLIGRPLEVLDLGDALCGPAPRRPEHLAALGRSIRSLVAPATSRIAVTASAGRSVASDAITVVAGRTERYADPATASDYIDAGAEVVVLRTRHRIQRPARARSTWSPAG